MDYDVTIVGSGFGGLTAGALLARNGLKVLVLEKHDKPGGFASQFRRKGYDFEVAIHSFEGYSPKNVRSQVFKYLGIDKRVNFLKVDNLYRLHGYKGQLDIPADWEGSKETLNKNFPCQSLGVDLFYRKMQQISDEFYNLAQDPDGIKFENPMFSVMFPNIHELIQVPLASFLTSTVSDSLLRWLLISNIGFFHNDPSRYPAAFFLLNQSHYLKGGAVYTEGGTQNLSNAFVDIIRENGGEVWLKSEVTEIDDSEGFVSMKVEPKVSSRDSFRVSSRYAVINAPLPYAMEKFFAPSSQTNSFKPSTSATTLYLGLKRPVHELYPVDFFNFFSERGSQDGVGTDNLNFSLVDSSTVDKSKMISKKFTADVVFLDSYERWQGAQASGSYEDLKYETSEKMIGRLKNLIPSIDQEIDVFELGTPLTIESFTNNTKGAAYGFDIASVPPALALERFSPHSCLSLKSNPNIKFASSWSSLFHGLTGASLAGFQAAQSILKDQGRPLKLS